MTCSRYLAACAALALLAGCGDKSTPAEGSLQGEVLEGTISDAMIPLDQVKSHAPLAIEAGDGGTGAASSPAAQTSSEADEVDAEQPTPTPAETPVTTVDGQTG